MGILARPLWEYAIKNEIQRGNTVLVVAHTNTLRGLMKHIDDIEGKRYSYVCICKYGLNYVSDVLPCFFRK